jgi:acyl-coenzyme A synthetase/AMP-(fatty) acid ligase
VVEKGIMSEAEALARKHPIAAFTLDALTAGAAKLRPDRVALTEAGPGLPTGSLSYGEFDRQVRAVAQHLGNLGLGPGERILIVTGARTACVVTMIAALNAGIEPLLVPIGLEAAHLAAVATSAGCVAITGPTSYGALNLEEALFEAAARSETIRVVATLGSGEADGAIDLAPERLQFDDAKSSPASEGRPRVGTLNARIEPIFHEQSALLAAALDFVGTAEISAGAHLLSTLAPASFASLMTGPVASLLSGAPLTLFGPFEAASFLALLDATGPNHCVVPATVLADFAKAGLLRDSVLASAIAVLRNNTAVTAGCDCSLILVHALDESGGITVERRPRANPKEASILSGEVLAPILPARQPERSWR